MSKTIKPIVFQHNQEHTHLSDVVDLSRTIFDDRVRQEIIKRLPLSVHITSADVSREGQLDILRDSYYVTEKADGLRKCVFINTAGRCFIFNPMNIRAEESSSSMDFMNQQHRGTVLDAELVKTPLGCALLLFDVVLHRGKEPPEELPLRAALLQEVLEGFTRVKREGEGGRGGTAAAAAATASTRHFPCRVCGCSAEVDIFGDRICFCDTCHGSYAPCDHGFAKSMLPLDGCRVCGCSAEVDVFGDRICFCDTCLGSFKACDHGFAPLDGCRVCGCSAEVDIFGDRICFCDTCHGSFKACDHGFVKSMLPLDGCRVCGCSAEVDVFGDRICFCDTCHGRNRACRPSCLQIDLMLVKTHVPWCRLQEKLHPTTAHLYPTDGLIFTPRHGAPRSLRSNHQRVRGEGEGEGAMSVLKWKPQITVDFLLDIGAIPSARGSEYLRFHVFVRASAGAGGVRGVAHSVQKDHVRFTSNELPLFLDISVRDLQEKQLSLQGLLAEVVEVAYGAEACAWELIRARPDKSKANSAKVVAELTSALLNPVSVLDIDQDTGCSESLPLAPLTALSLSPSPPPPTSPPSPAAGGGGEGGAVLDLQALCRRHGAIKNFLYGLAAGQHIADVCSGRGADMKRWLQNGVASVRAIERDAAAVHQARQRRAILMQKKEEKEEFSDSKGWQEEGNANDRSPASATTSSSSCDIKIYEMDIGTESSFSKEIRYFEEKVEYVYCHFAIHYIMSSCPDSSMRHFCHNVKQMMSGTAKLVITFLDYDKTGVHDPASGGSVCYCNENKEMLFGIKNSETNVKDKIDFFIGSIGHWHEESVVRPEALCELFASFGFHCEGVVPFEELSLLLPPAAGEGDCLNETTQKVSNMYACAVFTVIGSSTTAVPASSSSLLSPRPPQSTTNGVATTATHSVANNRRPCSLKLAMGMSASAFTSTEEVAAGVTRAPRSGRGQHLSSLCEDLLLGVLQFLPLDAAALLAMTAHTFRDACCGPQSRCVWQLQHIPRHLQTPHFQTRLGPAYDKYERIDPMEVRTRKLEYFSEIRFFEWIKTQCFDYCLEEEEERGEGKSDRNNRFRPVNEEEKKSDSNTPLSATTAPHEEPLANLSPPHFHCLFTFEMVLEFCHIRPHGQFFPSTHDDYYNGVYHGRHVADNHDYYEYTGGSWLKKLLRRGGIFPPLSDYYNYDPDYDHHPGEYDSDMSVPGDYNIMNL